MGISLSELGINALGGLTHPLEVHRPVLRAFLVRVALPGTEEQGFVNLARLGFDQLGKLLRLLHGLGAEVGYWLLLFEDRHINLLGFRVGSDWGAGLRVFRRC